MLKLQAAFSMVAKLIQHTPKRFFNARRVPKFIRATSHRIPPPCPYPPYCPNIKPFQWCNNGDILVERSTECWSRKIEAFLHSYCFSRDPSIVSLYLDPNHDYLDYLTEEYANSGDRWLAFKSEPRTGEKILVGVMVANKVYPWQADRIEKWAAQCCDPARVHLYFRAHCYRSPNLFNKYKVPFIYDIEVVGTRPDVAGQGAAHLLLRAALQYTKEMNFPLVQVIARNSYMNEPCRRFNLVHEWKMNYLDFSDMHGRNVLYPRFPHSAVNIFIRKAARCL